MLQQILYSICFGNANIDSCSTLWTVLKMIRCINTACDSSHCKLSVSIVTYLGSSRCRLSQAQGRSACSISHSCWEISQSEQCSHHSLNDPRFKLLPASCVSAFGRNPPPFQPFIGCREYPRWYFIKSWQSDYILTYFPTIGIVSPPPQLKQNTQGTGQGRSVTSW